MDTWRQIGRWSAWISLGMILAILFVGVARAAPDVADEESTSASAAAASLDTGWEAIEPPVFSLVTERVPVALPWRPLEPELIRGRRVVTEIFRPPIG